MEAEITIARRPLGELLVSRGLISEQELELALDEHRRTGKRLGEVLVELGLISGPELELALEEQRGAAVMKEGGFGTGLLSAIKGQRVRTGENGKGKAAVPLELVRPTASTDEAGSYLLFVPRPSGYGLVEHEGPAPATGARLEIGDTAYVVTKLGHSPLPHDGRSCAYLQALA